jgi:rfaE bifunctional protein kinase chain/domain
MTRKTLKSRLIRLVDHFQDLKVAVYGDFVLDEFVYGEISRVSREAPVLILHYNRSQIIPGGGANSINNLRALDAVPFPIGVIGDDEPGKELIKILQSSDIDVSSIVIEKGYTTPVKTRFLAGSPHTVKQQIVRVDRVEQDHSLSPTSKKMIEKHLLRKIRQVDGMIVSDYQLMSVDPSLLIKTIEKIDTPKIPVILDSRKRLTEFQGVLAATPNEEEVEQALKTDIGDDRKTVERAGSVLLKKMDARAILITRGSKGMCLFERGKKMMEIPVYGTDEVADVTGAGDTVAAVFTLSLIAGASFYEAARLANYAGGIVVMKRGTATLSRKELLNAIESD